MLKGFLEGRGWIFLFLILLRPLNKPVSSGAMSGKPYIKTGAILSPFPIVTIGLAHRKQKVWE